MYEDMGLVASYHGESIMLQQERLIVPGLGVVILVSAFVMGAPLIYLLLIGVLGLAAVGTYNLPHAVQVETRIAIAALGLVILIIYFNSLGFWLALLSFVAIGALQIRYRHSLRNPPHTTAWLNAVLRQRGATDPKAAQAEAADNGAAPSIAMPAMPGVLQGKVSIAGVMAAVLGIIVLLTAVMPWMSGGSDWESVVLSGWEVARWISQGGDSPLPYAFVWTLAGLAIASMLSVALPRVVPVVMGVLGLAVTVAAMVYMQDAMAWSEERVAGRSVGYGIGAYLSAVAFIAITALHLIPATYRPLGGNKTDG